MISVCEFGSECGDKELKCHAKRQFSFQNIKHVSKLKCESLDLIFL